MASVDLTAGQVMNDAAALLNDAARSVYTYTVQVPYLNIAIKELRKHFELANLPATDQTSDTLVLPAGDETLEFNAVPPGTVELPDDLVEIQRAWQRPTGSGQQFVPLDRMDGLPLESAGVEINILAGYVWEDQMMKFLPCTVDTDIKLEYVRQLFTEVADEDSEINCINADSFLAARTAALIAKYVEENEQRAAELNATAGISLDEVIGISNKGRQSMVTRRRPFRAGYKSRGY